MSKNNNNSNNDPWWKPGMQIFSGVSTWIVAPIIGALVLGKILDSRFGTKPWIFLGLTGVAFLFSSFGIVGVVRKYMKKIENEDKEKKNKNNI